MNKSAQLQIRISPDQKQRIKTKADQAGEDVSQWVLRRLLPECADELQSMIDVMAIPDSFKFLGQFVGEPGLHSAPYKPPIKKTHSQK